MNEENHIDALDFAILVDRKHGECFQLQHITKTVFKAVGTNNNKEGITHLRKIASGLAIKRYRILEVKN